MNEQKTHSKSNLWKKIGLVIFSILFTLFLSEVAAHIWFNQIASEEALKEYGLYTQITKDQWQITRHHYLNYCLTPNYRKEKMSHNSLGYRGKEF